MAGGIGTASVHVAGLTVAALVVVNAIGDVIDPRSGQVLAGARCSATSPQLMCSAEALLRGELPERLYPGTATTVGVVATDAVLDKSDCSRLATMAHDGLARTIVPVHTPFDGDTLFVLATGAARRSASLALLGTLAAEATARAVVRAVRHAVGDTQRPAMRNIQGP
jgi:L-aminopeptidase/D-esterase-like protein